jgi:uncharacterized protein YxeA
MKIKKEYATLIAVAIILIFLLSLFYLYNSNFKNVGNPLGNQNNVNNQIPENPQEKTLNFVSASCSVSGNSDTMKFKIQSTGSTIGKNEMNVTLDDSVELGSNFKDSSGNKLNSISLSAGTMSDEFSYTTADHKNPRKITVSSPAGAVDQFVTCS